MHALESHGALAPGVSVLTTHRHSDHAGGNDEARIAFERRTGTPLKVFGDAVVDRSPGITNHVSDGETFSVGSLSIEVISTPCHTKGSLCYYITAPGSPASVFTGDTIFVGGVGAFFEGTSRDMVQCMKRLAGLPASTLVWPGHDYALNFLPNASGLDTDNAPLKTQLEWATRCRQGKVPAVPSTIKTESETNIYMRCVTATALTGLLFQHGNHQAKVQMPTLPRSWTAPTRWSSAAVSSGLCRFYSEAGRQPG